MISLLKSEIEYFKVHLGIIAALPLIFSIFAFPNIMIFENAYFLKKYFWSVLIGIGTYAFVFSVWTLRIKENRERLHYLAPISKMKLSISRWIFGITPFVLIISYLLILYYYVPLSQVVFVRRAIAQLGLLLVFLASFDLIINLDLSLSGIFLKKRQIIITVIASLLIITSICIIYLVTLFVGELIGELIFNLWGMTVFTISSVLHYKKINFA